jgi:ketosteroid isomerase-like protein
VEQISQDWKDGYNSGDAPKVAALYTDDAYYLTQHFVTGIVHGHAAIQAYVQLGVDAHYHLDKIDILEKHCSRDFAYAITRYESTNAGVKAFGVNLVLMKKIDGKWKIVAHESAVPDPAAAVQKLPSIGKKQK